MRNTTLNTAAVVAAAVAALAGAAVAVAPSSVTAPGNTEGLTVVAHNEMGSADGQAPLDRDGLN
ncbi:hypothetical protein [Nonomuraea sp. NPDC050783]|uniref:hypothetical protein n=1 Tax=Nonomuraea sp. NPDC050783 TaxID=3154634 RepID=UPI003464EA0D